MVERYHQHLIENAAEARLVVHGGVVVVSAAIVVADGPTKRRWVCRWFRGSVA